MRIFLGLILIAISAALWLLTSSSPKAVPRARIAPAPNSPLVAPQQPEKALPAVSGPVRMEFRADEMATKVMIEVGRATRPAECSFALASRGESRLACLFVDAENFTYQLDADLSADSFPGLKQFDFKEAVDPQARTLSTYRSLAKTAMGYRSTAGDRLMILLCPRSAWTQIKLDCTSFSPVRTSLEGIAPRF